MTSYYYENPHISLSGTLGFLQSASNVEVETASGISRVLGSIAFIDIHDESVPIDRELKEPTADEVHRAYEAFLTDFVRSPSIEGSFAICWQPLSVIQRLKRADATEAKTLLEYQKSYLQRLPKIFEQAKARIAIEPDGYILDRNAAILIHLSVGLILLAEQVEGGQSERQWEWLDDALRVFRMTETQSIPPFYEQAKYPRTITLSYEIAKALMLSKSANRLFHQHKYEEALNTYSVALFGMWIANNDIFRWWNDEDELPDDKRTTEFVIDNAFESDLLEDEDGEPLSGIRYWDIPKGIFDFENSVRAFDALIDENARNTNWTVVANCCEILSGFWYLLSIPVSSEHIPERESGSASWNIAQGMALQKLSPDALADALAAIRDKEAETRLRLYFFGDTWDSLPDKARAALISADREYENGRGRRPIIFDHLRHAARAVVVEVLAKPYQEFLRSKADIEIKSFSVQSTIVDIEDDRSRLDLRPLIKSLFDASHFGEFIDASSLSSADKGFVKNRVRGKLLYLNGVANTANHNHSRTYRSFERDIRETYAEFLGIGRNGILPRLMRLRSMTDVNSPKRTSQPF